MNPDHVGERRTLGRTGASRVGADLADPRRRRRQPEPRGRQRRAARHRQGRSTPRRPRSTSSRSATRSGWRRPCSGSARWVTDTDARRCSSSASRCRCRPASLAAWAPSDTVLFVARIVGGLSAGMAYPTTLALITALWSGQPDAPESIALWSAIGGAIAALGPLVAGRAARALLVGLGLPRHAAAGRGRARPRARASSRPRQRDHRPGRQPRRRSCPSLLVGALILAINFAPVPNKGSAGARARGRRRRRGTGVRHPSAPRREPAVRPRTSPAVATFWVAACAGIIVFGSLMGAMFIGQQYLQNVLGYSTLDAGPRSCPPP